MPFIQTIVSVPLDAAKKERLTASYKSLCQKALGKPENFVMTSFQDGQSMYFQGSDAPAACVEVKIFGDYANGATEKMTPVITAALSKECGIAADRIYVMYYHTQHCGWNGENF